MRSLTVAAVFLTSFLCVALTSEARADPDVEGSLHGVAATGSSEGQAGYPETAAVPEGLEDVTWRGGCDIWETADCADYTCASPAPTQEVYEYVHGEEPSSLQALAAETCYQINDAPLSPSTVAAAFRRLTWPASELTIQPPNGRTAVNFDTYFFTDDTAPLTQTVTLLGQRVTIEATPTSFTWRYGDDATETTSTPGGPYPGGTVVHQYLQAGATAPSLDTTYTGSYRVGGGPWVGIPDSLTVTGAPQQLEIVEIDLKLVYDY